MPLYSCCWSSKYFFIEPKNNTMKEPDSLGTDNTVSQWLKFPAALVVDQARGPRSKKF